MGSLTDEDLVAGARIIRRIQGDCDCENPDCKRIRFLLAYIERLEAIQRCARKLAGFILGWWPGLEDGLGPWPPGDDHEVRHTARLVYDATDTGETK